MKNNDMNWIKDIDWSNVDDEKMRFFFTEAQNHNNALITDINSLNSKAFTLLAIGIPLLSFAVGLLLSFWDNSQLAYCLSCFSSLVFVALILLLLAVYPKRIYRSEAKPALFFKNNYYKASLYTIYSGGIVTLSNYIKENLKTMQYRARLISCAIIMLILSPVFSLLVFFLHG